MKNLMYGPGIPRRGFNHRDVPTTRTAPPTRSAASAHFSRQIISLEPWSSGRSILMCCTRRPSAGSPASLRIVSTSRRFIALPVTK